MMKKIIFYILFFLILSLAAAKADSAEQENPSELRPVHAHTPPKIDGILDDEVWQSGALIDGYFNTYNPLYGEKLPQRTAIYLAYDADNIYFAFYCYDTEPEKIKTSITRRDNNWNDDWVGFALDTCGARQFGYECFINPDGIQSDGYISSATGEDSSPDYIFDTGGKVVKDGYIVEIRFPLKNFRFSSGKEAVMNVIFWRRISRLGVSGSWPETKPGLGFMNSMGKIVYGELNNQLLLEVLPSITYGAIWDREAPNKWSSADDKLDFGVTAKYGITSTITTEFTYNPDFSQVESDSFQVLVNQRYPIFYSEKRPFFMEAGNLFNVSGLGDGDNNMLMVFNTRNIVDPEWGLQVNGESGKFAFGILGAGDEWPGRDYGADEDPNPNLGENELYLGGRVKFSFDNSNFVGALFTSKDFGGGYNRVIGGDLCWRTDGFSFKGNFLQSFTKDKDTLLETDGSAWLATINYDSKPFGGYIRWEHVGKGFQMDTAFYQRGDIDKYMVYIGPNIYLENENLSWIKKINPFVWGYYIHDLVTGEDDYFYLVSLRTFFTKQASLRFDYREFSEFWEGQQLKGSYFFLQGQVQWTNWLNDYMHFGIGEGNYYDSASPMVGDRVFFDVDATIQPNDKFTQFFDYTYQRMTSKIDGSELYNVSIFQSKSTYQFDEHLFFRALIQYDSYRQIVLTDLLLSYQLNPQTVLHLGYGSLHENKSWRDEQWINPDDLAQYYQTRQSIFLKGSYQIKF
jgi:hypothetical protein